MGSGIKFIFFLMLSFLLIACNGNRAAMEMAQKNKDVVRKYIEAFATKDVNVTKQTLADNYIYHGTGDMANADLNQYLEFIKGIQSAFPDSEFKLVDLIAEGDKVVYVAMFSGTNSGMMMGMPATDKKATGRSIGVVRIADGKIAEEWENFDELGLMQQLGVIPQPEM